MTDQDDELEQLRARHEATGIQLRHRTTGLTVFEAEQAHTDRATLLRLLDAARAELASIREAAGPFVEAASHHNADTSDSYCIENMYPGLTLGQLRRLAAALQEPSHD